MFLDITQLIGVFQEAIDALVSGSLIDSKGLIAV
jgi:hypothetical protein